MCLPFGDINEIQRNNNVRVHIMQQKSAHFTIEQTARQVNAVR